MRAREYLYAKNMILKGIVANGEGRMVKLKKQISLDAFDPHPGCFL
jgi:hypothetical protein